MAFIGYGCDIQISTNGGSSYATFGQVTELNLPNFKVKDVDTSNIQMANPWRSFQGGLIDGDVIKFKLIFAKANYNTVLSNIRLSQVAGQNVMFKFIFSDIVTTASTLVVSGYINGLGGMVPLDDMITCDVSLKVSGQPAFTQGT